MTVPGSTVAEALAARIAGLAPERLPSGLREAAENLVLDITGLCLAASATDYVRAAIATAEPGSATAIGHAGGLTAGEAALVNGMAAHGEDFDDTFEGGPVHAGAAIVPAMLAAAERFGLDGPSLLLGIVVGVETVCRLSTVAPKQVHKAGFHPTSVFGTIGAAAAVAASRRLDPPRLVAALGIAGSMASGIIEYLADGSWTKRLHPGWAAQAGLRAALLAEAGFVGPRSVFEGTHGLFNGFSHTTEGNFAALTGGFGEEWVAEGVAFKAFACGTMTHPYIDCAIRLRERGIAAERIASITCETAEGILHRLWDPLALKQAPPNAYSAKFSTPFCIAAGMILGDAGLAAFTEETVRDPRLIALAGKVGYVVDPQNPYPNAFTGHIRAVLTDGSVVEERQGFMRGGVEAPLSRAALEAKFAANAAFGGWAGARAEAAGALSRQLFDAGRVDLTPLRG